MITRTLTGGALALAVVLAAGAASARAARTACPTSNSPNTLVLADGSGQTAQLGKIFQGSLQVQLANTNGCPLTGDLAGINVDFYAPGSGASGTFASSGSTVAVVGTNAEGVATAPAFTANDTAGSYSVDAQSDYGSVNVYLTNTAGGLAASIAATGTTSEEATVDGPYPAPLQARVLDANGRPVQGATVTFAVVPGPTGAGASFLGGGQAAATTDANGLATSPPLLANGNPGRFAATASTADLSTVATYTLDNHAATMTIAAAAATVAVPTATVDTRYPQPLRARVLDAGGGPVEGASVTFVITTGTSGAGAVFLGGTTQANVLTDADGQAVSPPLVANKTAGSFTATATTDGASQPLGYTLKNRAGVPDAIAAGAASGQSTPTGSRFPVRLAVTVTDENGNAVAGATVVFTAPVRGPGGRFFAHGRVSRTARVKTNGSGVAIAPPFTANAKAGGYVVTAAVKGTSKRAAFALVNEQR